MLPAVPPSAVSRGVTIPDDFAQHWIVRGPSPELSFGLKDAHGAFWEWRDIEGWFSTPGLDTAIAPQGNADFALAASRFPMKERYITIHGVCHTETPDELWRARERLIRHWFRPNEAFDLIVEEPVPKRITVRTSGQIDMPWGEQMLSFAFSIPMVAPDPAKRGLELLSGATPPAPPGALTHAIPHTIPYGYQNSGGGSGTLSLVNAGNIPASPRLSVSGPVSTGWSVINETTGVTFALDLTLNQGQTVVIDMARQTATVNNVPVQVRLTGDWFHLAVGRNTLRFLAPESGDQSLLTVSAYSAYS